MINDTPSPQYMAVDDYVSHEPLELHFSGKNLKNMDGWFGKSDPIVEVYIQLDNTSEFKLVGKTEQITDNLNPDFKEHVQINYIFEINQNLKIEVKDVDEKENKAELIGSFEVLLANILMADAKDLSKNQKTFKIYNEAKKETG